MAAKLSPYEALEKENKELRRENEKLKKELAALREKRVVAK
jgi:cell division protein FtsB